MPPHLHKSKALLFAELVRKQPSPWRTPHSRPAKDFQLERCLGTGIPWQRNKPATGLPTARPRIQFMSLADRRIATLRCLQVAGRFGPRYLDSQPLDAALDRMKPTVIGLASSAPPTNRKQENAVLFRPTTSRFSPFGRGHGMSACAACRRAAGRWSEKEVSKTGCCRSPISMPSHLSHGVTSKFQSESDSSVTQGSNGTSSTYIPSPAGGPHQASASDNYSTPKATPDMIQRGSWQPRQS